MKTRDSIIPVVIALVALFGTGNDASAKEWTINARQDQLMKDINAAQKKNELTDKEAKKLRSDLADVARKEAKLRGKNNKQIPIDQQGKLEKGLNEVSVNIKKLALEKRVDAANNKADAVEKQADAKQDKKSK
jgi:ribosomal protein S13